MLGMRMTTKRRRERGERERREVGRRKSENKVEKGEKGWGVRSRRREVGRGGGVRIEWGRVGGGGE